MKSNKNVIVASKFFGIIMKSGQISYYLISLFLSVTFSSVFVAFVDYLEKLWHFTKVRAPLEIIERDNSKLFYVVKTKLYLVNQSNHSFGVPQN